MKNNPVDKTLHKIEKFLELKLEETEEGGKLGKEICEDSAELKGLILDEESKKNYIKIISQIKTHSTKLAADTLKSKRGPLNSDWKQLARQDQLKLKDEILKMQEFLLARENILRKRANEKLYGIDIQNLARRLRKEKAIDQVLRSQLTKLVENMGEEDLQTNVEECRERLNRISKWLLSLKEVKNAEG